jgi:hypothetical protein
MPFPALAQLPNIRPPKPIAAAPKAVTAVTATNNAKSPAKGKAPAKRRAFPVRRSVGVCPPQAAAANRLCEQHFFHLNLNGESSHQCLSIN